MKKMLIILAIFSLPFVIAKEEVPLLIDNSAIITDYEIDDTSSLIKYDKMKKSDKIKQVQEEQARYKTPKIKLDAEQINRQRALDFTTKQNNSMMLPTF